MTTIPLTAAQIKFLDELNIDKSTAEKTLQVALHFHANCLNEIEKQERQFWLEIIAANNLDENTTWQTAKIEGRMVVTEQKK